MSSPKSKILSDKKSETAHYRPAFHFSPATGWMNDPNGLVYDGGVYHLFYQHYPDNIIWGPMHWGHATSRDLFSWDEQPIAMAPDQLGMIFSGSIVIDRDNTSRLGRDGMAPWIALFTHHDMAGEKAGRSDYQSQSLAYSLDKGQSWTKYIGNPVIQNPVLKHFRDPKVSWHGATRRWIMVLAAGDRIIFYSSSNLIDWSKESELTCFEVADDNVLECPDLLTFDFDGREHWVLLVSQFRGAPNGGSGTHYIVGDFDGHHFTRHHEDMRWLDYGPDNYAGVTFHNAPGKPLLIGWMSNWAYAQAVPTAPWRSAMTLPRELELVEAEGRVVLRQRVAIDIDSAAVQTIKAEHVQHHHLLLANDLGDQLLIGYDSANHHYFVDRRQAGQSEFSIDFPIRATAPAKGAPGNVIIYLDTCSVELFADGGLTVMTALAFPRASLNRIELVPNSP
ncbi:MAG: hypothetical protein RL481_408 [Pseudomonadota bacterium]